MTERRFPLPWSVDELEACFVVKDGAGQKLAYVYYENDSGRRSAAKLTKDEARRIAADIAKLTPSDVRVLVGIISLLLASANSQAGT